MSQEKSTLPPIKILFQNSLSLIKEKFFLLLGVMMIPAALSSIFLILSVVYQDQISRSPNYFISSIGLFYLVLLIAAYTASVYVLNGLSFSLAWFMAGKKLRSALWLYFLYAAVIAGGLLLGIVPGIIFAVSFSLIVYILVFEEDKGSRVLVKSKEYIKGYWWAAFGRTLLFTLPAILIPTVRAFTDNYGGSLVPILPLEILDKIFSIFAVVFGYVLYRQFTKLKPEVQSLQIPKLRKRKWVFFAFFGFAVMFMFSASSSRDLIQDRKDRSVMEFLESAFKDDRKTFDLNDPDDVAKSALSFAAEEIEKRFPYITRISDPESIFPHRFKDRKNMINWISDLKEALKEFENYEKKYEEILQDSENIIRTSGISEKRKEELINYFSKGARDKMALELLSKQIDARKRLVKKELSLYEFMLANYDDYRIDLDEYGEDAVYFASDDNLEVYNRFASEIAILSGEVEKIYSEISDYQNKRLKSQGVNISASEIERLLEY